MWVCPECGRKFSRNLQSHSCVQYNLDDLFFGKGDEARFLYDRLMEKVTLFGEVEARAGKGGITVRRLSGFLNILVEKRHLTIIFVSDKPIDEFPVYQNYQYSSQRFHNALKIESEDEIDDQLIRWLYAAWTLAV